jgi:hypothetical protein
MTKYRWLITLLIIALMAGYYLLGTGYMKQRLLHQRLDIQIAEANRTQAQFPKPAPDLEQRLAAVRVKLAAAEGEFPLEVNSTRVIDSMLTLANKVGVKAIPLATQPWQAEKSGEHSYYVFRLNVSVAGSFSELVKFTETLESIASPAFVIEHLNTTREVAPSFEEGLTEERAPVSAIMTLAVYARSAPAE